jgi:hypothetical protein
LEKGIIHDKYKGTLENNVDLISAAIENNPREIKRFINNYIVAYEIHSSNKDKKIDPIHLLLVQAINVRWNNFYQLLVGSSKESRKEIFDEIKEYKDMQPDKRILQLESDKTEEGFSPENKRILKDFRLEEELWKFLKAIYDVMLQITDWETYRRAAESVKEPSIEEIPIEALRNMPNEEYFNR